MNSLFRIALLAVGLTAGAAPAQTAYSWNFSGSDNWSNETRWSPVGVPGAADDVTVAIGSASAYTVTVNTTQAANTLLVNNANAILRDLGGANTFSVGTLTVSAGRFNQDTGILSLGAGGATVNGSGFFAFSNGTVAGTGPVNVTIANGFSWDNGTLKTALNLANGGTMVSGLGTKILGDGGALNMNGGTTTFTGTIKYSGAGSVTVAAGATMDWTADASVVKDTAYAGAAPFTINGTLKKSGGTGTGSFDTGLSLTNAGTIQVSSGTLLVNSDLVNTGTITADAGKEFKFGTGTLTFNAGSQVTGAGTFHLRGGTSTSAVIDLQADTPASNFNFEIGTVQGTKTLTVTGPLTWKQGVVGGAATLKATGGGSITGSATVSTGLADLSAGTFDWSGGNITFSGNGTLHVAAGATLSTAGNNNFTRSSGSPIVQNDGTVEKTGGTGSMILTSGLAFNNAGTLRVTSGKITLQGTLTNTGTLDVGSGAELFVDGGTANLNAGTTMTGTGRVNVDSAGSTLALNAAVSFPGGLRLVRGDVTGTGSLTVAGPFTWGVFNGSVGGSATINAAGGGDWTASGDRLVSTGTVNLTGGTFTWSSADIHFSGNGALTVGAAAVLDNVGTRSVVRDAGTAPTFTVNGTYKKSAGAGTSQIQAGVNFVNAGLTDVQAGALAVRTNTTNTGTLRASTGTLLFDQAVTLAGTGTIDVGVGGTLTVNASGATITVPSGMTLANAGTVQVTDGTLVVHPSAVIANYTSGTQTLAGGTWRAQDHTFDLGRTVGTVAAATTVEVIGSSGSMTGLTGLAQVNGTVRLLSGASLTPTAATVNVAGLLEVATGTFGKGVTVQSGGTLLGKGTVAGPVAVQSGGTITPGPGPGVLTVANTALAGGGTYVWELNSWSATPNAGSNFDQLKGSAVAKLDLSGASAGNRVTVKVVSLDGSNNPGLVPAFDNTAARSWVIADFSDGNAANGVQGFATDKFTLDTSGFQNPVGGGVFALSTDPLSNQLVLTFTPVPEPGAGLALGGLVLGGAACLRRRRPVKVARGGVSRSLAALQS